MEAKLKLAWASVFWIVLGGVVRTLGHEGVYIGMWITSLVLLVLVFVMLVWERRQGKQ